MCDCGMANGLVTAVGALLTDSARRAILAGEAMFSRTDRRM
jgi:hypothetical protein